MKTIEELKTILGSNFNPNKLQVIGERTSKTFTNQFDDTLYFLWKDKLLTIKGTTKAGMSKAVTQPNTISGLTGIAIIKPNFYKDIYQWNNGIETRKRPWNQPFFQQVGLISVYRDNDIDNELDYIQPQQGYFGINGHVMSIKGASYGKVDNWSEGCWGAVSTEWVKVIEFVNDYLSKGNKNSFDYCLFETLS